MSDTLGRVALLLPVPVGSSAISDAPAIASRQTISNQALYEPVTSNSLPASSGPTLAQVPKNAPVVADTEANAP